MDSRLKDVVLEMAAQALQDARWEIPSDFLTYTHYLRVVKELDWNSSPGYPYCLNCTTNRLFFEVNNLGEPSQLACERVWMIVKERLEQRDADPVRLFVKPEPHTEKKLAVGRYRLISSVSVIDQIIDHMIFGAFNKALIINCHYTPIKTGWTPYCGGWREVPVSGTVACDKSAWDWTVKPWLIENELLLRQMLCNNLTAQWKDLAVWRYSKLFFDNRFVTSGGLVLKQKEPGVMKSGCVNTIASNSLMQLILHLRCAVELNLDLGFLWAMGDDVIQDYQPQEYFDLLSQFCVLKEVTPNVEFAGFTYYGYRCEPNYKGKHAYNLLHQDERFHNETSDSYALLYHRSKYRDAMRNILRDINHDLPPLSFIDRVWSG
uniref:RNA-directed RNA polymerase C-terminal domain-containing protein n=1 Tax=Riboviria sp. TaxID=2585031 RepID=A0A8K1U2C5_9VIRU|nr:MAG: hypothetical protein 1 [Riboviria sp.]